MIYWKSRDGAKMVRKFVTPEQIINKLRESKKVKLFLTLAAGIILIGLIGFGDFKTGYEIGSSLFYVIPIAIITWLTNRWLGLAASTVCALVWCLADVASGHLYSYPFILAWNTFVRFGFFVIVTLLLSTLRRELEHEKEIARIDYLTGALNTRFFIELVQIEIHRLQRYARPFTLVYIDLDNFKAVNDHFGHSEGDNVLRRVASYLRKSLRKTDMVARLGGDEFALLLPETKEESSQVILSKIQKGLLEEMRLGNWPITISVGVVTCISVPNTAEELIRIADDTMYSAKQAGKNTIKYFTYAV
jgi:diguanylate cyclase (GGDEF)-like protein